MAKNLKTHRVILVKEAGTVNMYSEYSTGSSTDGTDLTGEGKCVKRTLSGAEQTDADSCFDKSETDCNSDEGIS